MRTPRLIFNMIKTASHYYYFPTAGLLFHIARLDEVYQGAPRGVYISDDFVSQNPVLWTAERNGVIYRFIALNPLEGIPQNAPIVIAYKLTERMHDQSKPGHPTAIAVYAEWKTDLERSRDLLETAIDEGTDSSEIMQLGRQLQTDGHALSCDFINVLRRKFAQYWLEYPSNPLQWLSVAYFSDKRQGWYLIKAPEDYAPPTFPLDRLTETFPSSHPYILFQMLDIGDTIQPGEMENPTPYTFAEEMISTALVELSQKRTRSAIIHAIIALESSANRGLEKLLKSRLVGLAKGSVLDAISKELSVVTLARVVHFHATSDSPKVDWEKIKTLYETRNEVIHRGRRRLPKYDVLRAQLIEVFNCIKEIEEALARMTANPP